MKNEMENIRENNVWESKELIVNEEKTNIVGTRWVFARQADENGTYSRFKARLVAKGYLEKYGLDYDEVYAPVAKYTSIRLQLAIAAEKEFKVFQDDVKAAYLNAPLDQPKWIRLPDGKVVFLKKALYGLKESGRCWFKLFEKFMIENGFTQSKADKCIFFCQNMILGLYVDDILTAGTPEIVEEFRLKLGRKFKLSRKEEKPKRT
jgi:hypothetical protein